MATELRIFAADLLNKNFKDILGHDFLLEDNDTKFDENEGKSAFNIQHGVKCAERYCR